MNRHLHVACALIVDNHKVLAAQRSEAMSLPLKWEFPGGKIEAGEGPVDCLRRELMEELGITVAIGDGLPHATHHYADFTVTLYPFVCRISGGSINLHEHRDMIWIEPQRMAELDFAEADLPVIGNFMSYLADSGCGVNP